MRHVPNENGHCGSKNSAEIGFKLDSRLSVTSEQAAGNLAPTCDDEEDEESDLRSQNFFWQRTAITPPTEWGQNVLSEES
jgi:hypothetical protein